VRRIRTGIPVRPGPRRIVRVGDLSAINEILRQRPERFRRWTEIAAISKENGADEVFAAEGEDWRRQRRLAVTALNSNHLQRHFAVIRLATERLYDRLAAAARQGAPCAIHEQFKSFTLDVTCALAFGHWITGETLVMHGGQILVTATADGASERVAGWLG
jgi:cytochrome P450